MLCFKICNYAYQIFRYQFLEKNNGIQKLVSLRLQKKYGTLSYHYMSFVSI